MATALQAVRREAGRQHLSPMYLRLQNDHRPISCDQPCLPAGLIGGFLGSGTVQ